MKLSKLVKGAAIAGGILVAVRGLDDRLETIHYFIKSPKVPKEFDGFRIVQISDVHASAVPGLVDEIRGESPDIIVSTGDLVHDRGSYEPGISLMNRLMEIAPVYAVTGNHDLRRVDYMKFQSEIDKTGVRTLRNESEVIKRGDSQITVTGIDDPFSNAGDMPENVIMSSLQEVEETEDYHIVLFHRANHMELFKNRGFDLVLSGHMHGGQIRLPNGRGVCAPKSSWTNGTPMLFPKYFAGRKVHNGTNMIINRGIGNPMLIPRLFNRPELTVVVLKHKEEK